MQVTLGLKYHTIPRHRSRFYCFKGLIASRIKCLIFSEDLQNSGVKRIMILSVCRRVAVDPIFLGGPGPDCLSTRVGPRWLGFCGIWDLLIAEIVCFGRTATFSSFNLIFAV